MRAVGGSVRRDRAGSVPAGRRRLTLLLGGCAFLLVLAALLGALLIAPTEATMGDVQRIFYFHMPSAWVALGPAFTVCLAASILFLWRRDMRYDRVAAASAELGILFTTITLATGPLWAKPVWGAYWTWDPRLTTTLVLWFIYVSYLIIRSNLPPGPRRARLSAVFGIVGWIDIPVVFMSIRWWRTIHPEVISLSGLDLDATMAWVLGLSLLAFTVLYVFLLLIRVEQERLRAEMDAAWNAML